MIWGVIAVNRENKQGEKEVKQERKNITIFCHFSFKRPRGAGYGLFAVAFYWDFEGKKLITAKTRKFDLWEDHQWITAIQAYEHALGTIHEYQGMMREAGIKQVMLVTDNSILAGWIEEPTKNKKYTDYMNRAVQMYRVGAPKELVIGIGLCEPRDYEKSYKYCKEERVVNNYKPKRKEKATGYKINIGEYKSAIDLVGEDIAIPEIDKLKEI